MQKVNLPDGRTLNIPNDLDPAKREELANAVKSEYNIDINEASLGEWLVDKPISVARGLSQMIPTGVKGIAGLVAGSDSDIVKNLSDYQNYVATESALSSNPKFRGTFGTKLAEGAGSLIGFGGAAFAGRKLASKGIVSDKVGRFGVPGAFAVPMGMGEQVSLLEESRALGEQPNAIAEKLAILTGGVIGMSELAPIERLFRSIPKNALKNPTVQELLTTRLKSAAATGTAEAFQEAGAGIAQDLTAVGLYSDELPIGDSALEEFTIGGILGATADLLINSIGNRRSISSQRLKDAESKARENRTVLQSKDKFNRAQGQETVEEFQQPIIKQKPDIPVPPIVDVAPPDLGVIQNPDGQFSVVDYNNIEQPIISSHADETKALLAKNNAQTNYERKVLEVQVDNDAYIIGMPDSDSAKMLGRTVLDPNITQINLSTLIGYDSTLSEDFKKELNEEKSATYPGKPFRQILENKRAKLEKTSKYLESKGLELKSSFSMPEIKKVLNKKDYNDLLTGFANHAFAKSEEAGEPSIRADVDQVDVTIKNIKAIADAKNIVLDFKDPAVRYAAQQWTGFEDIPKTRNRGAKELFLARIHSLPAFNTKTKFPDFRPRTYTGVDMANFVASAQNIEFSKKDLIEAGPESIRNNKESTDQFFNDLIDSGRAVKVEGKNKYKITDDFEYTVARRQEGFGETPDEFGAKLRAEKATGKNKLSDEAIENLIRSEEVRQEKVLPPKQLEAKLMNFKETVKEGRTNKFARELQNKLNKVGLGDVGIVVSNDILSTTTLAETESGEIIFDPRVTRETATQGVVEGEYDRDTDIIFLSLNAINPDGTATDEQILQRLDRVMDHEMIHAFRAKDLITEKEYQYLRNQVKSRKVPKEYDEISKGETFYTRSERLNGRQVEVRSKEEREEFIVEEAIAEMYRAREFKDITPKAETILEKIVEFFKSMGTAMRVSGYADSSEIFADIESGKVGARQRGEVRTLRELDKISMAREQGILGGLDAPPSAVPEEPETKIDTSDTQDIEEEFGKGVLITPTTSFNDVESDTDPITGVSLTLGALQRSGGYNKWELTPEEYAADRKLILDRFYKTTGRKVTAKSKFDEVENISSLEVLEWLSKNGPTQDYRVIANRLLVQQKKLKRINGINTYFAIVRDGSQRFVGKGLDYKGWVGISYPPFNPGGLWAAYGNDKAVQQVYLSDTAGTETSPGNNGVSFDTMLHELVHQTTQAATRFYEGSRATKESQQLTKDLEEVRRILIEEIEKRTGITGGQNDYGYINDDAALKLRDEYGAGGVKIVYAAANIQETLAVGFTNRYAQDFMDSIPYKGTKKTLWDKFTESIRKLLSLPAKTDSLFSEFLRISGKLTKLTNTQLEELKKSYIVSSDVGPPLVSPAFSRQGSQTTKKIQEGLYEYRGFVIEDMQKRAGAPTKVWSFGKIPEGKSWTYAEYEDSANSLKEAKEFIDRAYFNEGDIPTFSRQSLESELSSLQTQLYNAESLENADRRYVGTTKGNRNAKKIQDIRNRIADVEQQIAQPVDPEQLPLFSRTQKDEKKIRTIARENRKRLKEEYKNDPDAVDEIIEEFEGEELFSDGSGFIDGITTNRGYMDDIPLSFSSERLSKKVLEDYGYEEIFEGEMSSELRDKDNQQNYYVDLGQNKFRVYFNRYGNKRNQATITNPTLDELMNNSWFEKERRSSDIPLFSRQSKTPPKYLIPENLNINAIDINQIMAQLDQSRKDGTRENPGELKNNIIDIFEKNPRLLTNSREFLSNFAKGKLQNKLILYRNLNIPEGENIKNYGQFPFDDYASTTLDHRQALAIGSNISRRNQTPREILRYEVPLNRVEAYVPLLLISIKDKHLQLEEDSIREVYEESEADEFLTEAEELFDSYIDEAEVLVDLRDIKPTYQFSPEEGTFGQYTREASIIRDVPLFSRSQRFTGEANTSEKIALQKATETVEEFTRKTPRGEVPLYNLNASDVALKAAYDYINDPSAPTIDELPNYSRVEKVIPDDLKGVVNKGGYVPARRPWYDRFIDEVKDPRTNIRKFFKDTRQNYIDKLDKVEKKILQGSEEFEEVRLANNSADTAAIAALRQADKARGIFQGMLTRGFAVDTIEGEAAWTSTQELEIDTVHNPFIEGNTGKGGLLQITAPLYSDPAIDLEGIFGTYAKLKRVQEFQESGRQVESPFTQQDLEFINNIEANYPVVVEVYNNYQKWNNKLIDFAQAKGLLNEEQADEWRAKSTYYPFYRDMIEEEGITAPRIGGGSLPNNPLNIKLKGSEEAIDVPPIEAIARNSLSILTASMKNDGAAKLIRDLETMGEAELLAPNQTGGANTIFVFENGFKKYYNIVDPELFHGIRALGGAEVGFITKMLAFPATILRDTVTRDPGFIAVNLLRDTLSATVTSGVNLSAGEDGFTPMVDTIKNMFADMTDLEKFGVIGGYDFANDEGDVVDYLARTRRQQGLSNDNGISAQDAFYKLWDGLGGLTTKSDGATRKGVFDAVYKKLKKDGYTEAQAQSEAAYQALEIINFGRRGLSPMFRVITSAIPFLNARIQGLDVIYRSSFGGTYSAQDKLQEGETLDDLKKRIFKRTALRGGMIMASTMLYYLLVSDTDEYKAVDRQIRDDNWLIPTPFDYTLKIPIPFEIGMMFKALPERFIDLVLGEKVLGVKESVEKDPFESIKRQIGQSANIPFLSGDISIQAVKPLFEAVINRNSFTNNEIVPYYKLKREEGYQSSPQTNELARLIGEAINVSPTKIEHVLNGYTGTLGGYVLDIVDSLTRTATGSPFIPNNIFSNPTNFAQYPLIKRLVIDNKKMGGYQQQFYELRGEVDSAVQTLNSLRKQKRFDELAAYKSDVKGLIKVKGKVRAMERYMANWRNRRDRLMRRTDISVMVKADLLEELETEMKIRLAFVPELRKKANVPILQGGL